MADAPASFSVAVPTMGRTNELEALLESIRQSTAQPRQIIIVDQNGDDRLGGIAGRFPDLPIEHHAVSFRGLSAAKNYAARAATGDVLFTPDDDCTVMPATFGSALDELERTQADVVFGKCIDETGADSIVRFRAEPGWLTRPTMKGMFVEPASAARTNIVREIPFDETLGAGRFHGAEEGHDWVLRLLNGGKRVFFQPAITFRHPRTISDYGSPAALRRVFYYRSGFGRLCRKHGMWGSYARRVALVAGGILAYSVTDRSRARYYVAELAGLLAGVSVEP